MGYMGGPTSIDGLSICQVTPQDVHVLSRGSQVFYFGMLPHRVIVNTRITVLHFLKGIPIGYITFIWSGSIPSLTCFAFTLLKHIPTCDWWDYRKM